MMYNNETRPNNVIFTVEVGTAAETKSLAGDFNPESSNKNSLL